MRILLVDDHQLFRAALQELLNAQGLTTESGSGQDDVLGLVDSFGPDLVLLDLRMPGQDGLAVLRQIHERHPGLPVVMLTGSEEERDLFDCLRAGAQGYLLKHNDPEYLISALHQATDGKIAVAPQLTDTLARALGQPPDRTEPGPPDPFAGLTPRERDILERLAAGESNKVIARHLGISDGTVKLHVKSVLRKLGVHSRVEAAIKAVDFGLTRRTTT
ncbi:response regulator [Halorhodospira halophila]|uniref:Two component transcriptional regulator, LuxR family n=1 Tax=Halorhodospira halophila (strain DSM 244 / SL1) TaxID=349124 RepID=A1WYG7_HALHL|nr:response regulator transcription factor [Halorhodospira halophila]ABM62729.1 two component transcriptional regulator, LuxR family [Halorhodospira halophila SL1]MBK1728148.1 DNA-binding response regulator [Halorhodospira halophila]